MSTTPPPRWNATLAPPSVADDPSHDEYFRHNAEVPPAAVVVFHGIGEQVRFETLSRAASMLLTEAYERGATGYSVIIRSVPKDETSNKLEVRAEVSWTENDGTPRQVHVYESYWAPLTIGKVTYWETVRFLIGAGKSGLYGAFFSGKSGTFDRWLFGGFKTLKISPTTVPLLLVLLILMGFVTAIIGMAAAAIAGVARQMGAGGVRLETYNALSFVYKQVALPLNEIAKIGQRLFSHATSGSDNQLWFEPNLSWQHWGQALLAFLLWIILIRAAFGARNLLTQYAGSLVGYLSPYKGSKFEDLRNQIQRRGLELASVVYNGHQLPSKWIPKYENIVILGHSLGSVIAYDTLNALINIQAAHLEQGVPNPVIERTRGLITFGCPLDKTAFLFRVQLRASQGRLDRESELRETMVSAVQPLIVDYDLYRFNHTPPPRRPKWINLWSRMDVVSGRLDYYDDPACPASAPQRVQNLIDPDAWIPLAAHNQYWTKKLLRKTLYSELF